MNINTLITAAFTITVIQLSSSAVAQKYPTKPIRLIIPFAPGGGNDILGRQAALGMSEILGQQVVADNRGGAGGGIGMELAAAASPDGYTIVVGHIGTLAVKPTMEANLKYDPLRDFQPISLVAMQPALMVVNPSFPAKNVAQFIALAKSKPGTVSYGSGGVGGANHLTAEYFALLTKIKLVHVPYRSAGLAVTDTIAGQVFMALPAVIAGINHVRSGRLRALGVSSESRLPIAPEIPTIVESGVPEFKVSQWYGILAPGKTPKPIVSELNRALVTTLSTPEFKRSMQNQGAEAAPSTPEEFRNLIKVELARWEPVITAAGLRH